MDEVFNGPEKETQMADSNKIMITSDTNVLLLYIFVIYCIAIFIL